MQQKKTSHLFTANVCRAIPRMTNALSQINRFHKDMLLNRETEQQNKETNVTSDQMTSEYKALRRNPPEVRLTSGQKL